MEPAGDSGRRLTRVWALMNTAWCASRRACSARLRWAVCSAGLFAGCTVVGFGKHSKCTTVCSAGHDYSGVGGRAEGAQARGYFLGCLQKQLLDGLRSAQTGCTCILMYASLWTAEIANALQTASAQVKEQVEGDNQVRNPKRERMAYSLATGRLEHSYLGEGPDPPTHCHPRSQWT